MSRAGDGADRVATRPRQRGAMASPPATSERSGAGWTAGRSRPIGQRLEDRTVEGELRCTLDDDSAEEQARATTARIAPSVTSTSTPSTPAGRLRQLPQARRRQQAELPSARSEALVLEAAPRARRTRPRDAHPGPEPRTARPTRRRPRTDLLPVRDMPRPGGSGADRRRRGCFRPDRPRATAVAHDRETSDGDPQEREAGATVTEVLRPGYRLKGRVSGPRWCGSESRRAREGRVAMAPQRSGSRPTTTKCSASPRRRPRRRSRAPIASSRSSTTLTRTLAPRTGSRRSARPTTSLATPISARNTTKSAASDPAGGLGGFGRRRRRHGGFDFHVEDLGDLFGGLFGRGARAAGRRAAPGAGPSAAATSKPSSTCPSTRPSRAPSRRSTSRPAPLRNLRRHWLAAWNDARHLSSLRRHAAAQRQSGPVLARPRHAPNAGPRDQGRRSLPDVLWHRASSVANAR